MLWFYTTNQNSFKDQQSHILFMGVALWILQLLQNIQV